MEKEDKDLLLKYLCMALPYGVKVLINSYQEGCADWIGELSYKDLECFALDVVYKYVKPYLRPMSSMTEEERSTIGKILKENRISPFGKVENSGVDNLLLSCINSSNVLINWLLEHHFDFLDLIPKGLAIEVTESNNSYKR